MIPLKTLCTAAAGRRIAPGEAWKCTTCRRGGKRRQLWRYKDRWWCSTCFMREEDEDRRTPGTEQ